MIRHTLEKKGIPTSNAHTHAHTHANTGSHTVLLCLCHLLQLLLLQRVHYVCQASFAALRRAESEADH